MNPFLNVVSSNKDHLCSDLVIPISEVVYLQQQFDTSSDKETAKTIATSEHWHHFQGLLNTGSSHHTCPVLRFQNFCLLGRRCIPQDRSPLIGSSQHPKHCDTARSKRKDKLIPMIHFSAKTLTFETSDELSPSRRTWLDSFQKLKIFFKEILPVSLDCRISLTGGSIDANCDNLPCASQHSTQLSNVQLSSTVSCVNSVRVHRCKSASNHQNSSQLPQPSAISPLIVPTSRDLQILSATEHDLPITSRNH